MTLSPEVVCAAVRFERLRLAELLESLTSEEWAAPSLCAGWSVHTVAAHLTVTTRTSLATALAQAVRARGNFDRMADHMAQSRAATFAPGELIEQLRDSARSSRRMPGSGPMDPLMDLAIHGQDITRPLGRPHAVPQELAPAVLHYVAENRMLGVPARIDGLTFTATDVDWSTGRGREVRGSAADVLLAMTARPAGLDGLTGEGAGVVAERMAASGSRAARRQHGAAKRQGDRHT